MIHVMCNEINNYRRLLTFFVKDIKTYKGFVLADIHLKQIRLCFHKSHQKWLSKNAKKKKISKKATMFCICTSIIFIHNHFQDLKNRLSLYKMDTFALMEKFYEEKLEQQVIFKFIIKFEKKLDKVFGL